MTDTYEIKDSGNEQVDGIYTVSKNLWSLKEVTTLTIEGVVYTLRDASKVSLPLTEGTDGQVLAKKGEGTEWVTIKVPEIDLSNYYTKGEIDDKKYLTVETDPTVPAWAKEATKPSYTYNEIQNTPDLSIYAKVTDLGGKVDKKEGYSLVSDTEIQRLQTVTNYDDSTIQNSITVLQTNKADKGELFSKNYNDLTNIPDLSIYATKEDTAELSYTAFEVYPHTETLTEFTAPVEASTIHALTFRSEQDNDQMDIVVDWGDGYKTTVSDIAHTGNEGDYRYYVSHDYATTGKFTVKITGKSYFGMIPDYQANRNLVSRIFDFDLPIADHLRNYANLCMGAKCLSKVNVFNSNLNKNATNISNLFAYCTNLTEAVGFSSANNWQAVLNVFLDCVNLTTTDFRLPDSVNSTNDQEYYAVFDNCSKLAKDINSLLPRNGFYGKNRINLGYTFRNCSSLTGTVPAKILWEDKTVDWIGVPDNSGVGPFVGCSDELRAQIPVSWGGTNNFIDYRRDVSEETDYTAFEVYPNNVAIEAGKHEDLGTIKEGFRNQVAMYFNLISDKAQADQNVYIDWGDGCIIKLSELTATTYAEGKAAGHFSWVVTTADGEAYNYAIYHNYEAGKQNKRLIVKIYGNTYSNLNFNASSIDQNKNNLICRIFDKDLPIASHLTDLSGMCMYAVRLVSVDLDFVLSNIHRFTVTDLFTGCTNLTKLCGSFDLTEAGYTALGLTSMPESYAMSQAINYVDGAVRLIDSLKADKDDVTALQEILGTLNTELDEVLTELE